MHATDAVQKQFWFCNHTPVDGRLEAEGGGDGNAGGGDNDDNGGMHNNYINI